MTVCKNRVVLQKSLELARERNDVVFVLMAAQSCVWKLISVTWEVHEMFLKCAWKHEVRHRKIHNEMSWVMSEEVMKNIRAKQDAMSSFYTRALKLSQEALKNTLDFIVTAKWDLVSTPAVSFLPVVQEVNSALQHRWAEKSEEEELRREYEELTKDTLGPSLESRILYNKKIQEKLDEMGIAYDFLKKQIKADEQLLKKIDWEPAPKEDKEKSEPKEKPVVKRTLKKAEAQ